MQTNNITILLPEDVYLYRDTGGLLHGVIKGKKYDELLLYLAFPIVYPNSYVSIHTKENIELGVVRELTELDNNSAEIMKEELELRYFLPRVTRIDSIKKRSDLWFWELQTHLGPISLIMRNLHEYIQVIGDKRIILTDLEGRRCDIPDWVQLDEHSKKLLKDIL